MTNINMMPNRRYSKLIQFRYLEEKSNEETAELLEMSMDNYYNKHKRAKAQFKTISILIDRTIEFVHSLK